MKSLESVPSRITLESKGMHEADVYFPITSLWNKIYMTLFAIMFIGFGVLSFFLFSQDENPGIMAIVWCSMWGMFSLGVVLSMSYVFFGQGHLEVRKHYFCIHQKGLFLHKYCVVHKGDVAKIKIPEYGEIQILPEVKRYYYIPSKFLHKKEKEWLVELLQEYVDIYKKEIPTGEIMPSSDRIDVNHFGKNNAAISFKTCSSIDVLFGCLSCLIFIFCNLSFISVHDGRTFDIFAIFFWLGVLAVPAVGTLFAIFAKTTVEIQGSNVTRSIQALVYKSSSSISGITGVYNSNGEGDYGLHITGRHKRTLNIPSRSFTPDEEIWLLEFARSNIVVTEEDPEGENVPLRSIPLSNKRFIFDVLGDKEANLSFPTHAYWESIVIIVIFGLLLVVPTMLIDYQALLNRSNELFLIVVSGILFFTFLYIRTAFLSIYGMFRLEMSDNGVKAMIPGKLRNKEIYISREEIKEIIYFYIAECEYPYALDIISTEKRKRIEIRSSVIKIEDQGFIAECLRKILDMPVTERK